ncbi:hypothetical protein CB1_000252003 [Camelus ferus]|nr:hypothetical protein CB1_000252003 [Camelus ferus]
MGYGADHERFNSRLLLSIVLSSGSIIMNGSSVVNTSPNVKSKEDQALNGHDEKENPFAEYMWMENEEDFNRQVEEELQEQEFLDRCFQEMLDEEDQDWFIPSRDLPQAMGQLQQQFNGLSVSDGHDSEDILEGPGLKRCLTGTSDATIRLITYKVKEHGGGFATSSLMLSGPLSPFHTSPTLFLRKDVVAKEVSAAESELKERIQSCPSSQGPEKDSGFCMAAAAAV